MPSASHRRNRNRNRSTRKRYNGGYLSPVDYSNPGPMKLNLAQGNQFLNYHSGQHGGSAVTSGYSAYPGAVTEGSFTSGVPLDSARQTGLMAAYRDIAGLKDQAGGYKKNRKGSRKNKKSSRKNKKSSRKNKKSSRKNKKSSRKTRKMYRKQRGGDFVRWGGARRHVGGSMQDMENPMSVAESTKMLISPQMQAQTGLNPEWKLAENPASFNPQ